MSETLEAEKNGVRAYGPMVAAALAVRSLSFRFFIATGLIRSCWSTGRLAGSAFAGRGPRFGMCLPTRTDDGVAPVYAYLLAVVFRLFGTTRSRRLWRRWR